MSNKVVITCFTDVKGSTSRTEKIGNEAMGHIRRDHTRIVKFLVQSSAGARYVKDLGDGHMIQFSLLEPAFKFAVQLQQFYLPQPNYSRVLLKIRIGLYLGVVDPSGSDIFGSGVNTAARVVGKTVPGEIWVNKELLKNISKVWGENSKKLYFKSCGQHKLKGITKPPTQELFSFNWSIYKKDHPEYGLTSVVLEHFKNASIVLSNLSASDIDRPASIIWPVVPRDVVNAIHRGQIEMIKLLAMIGWEVAILIADCGAKENPSKEYSEKFKNSITKYASLRGIKNIKFFFMRDLYKPKSCDCHLIHSYFQCVISDLTIQDLLYINQKDYAQKIQETIKKSIALDFLRPALTIAAVFHIAQKLEKKCIVIVGYDEKIQWERAYDIPNSRSRFGVLFNPILQMNTGYQAHQEKNWPHWDSYDEMVEDMKKSKLAWWTLQLHAYLPEFPTKTISINGKTISPRDWKKTDNLGRKIDYSDLASHVFDNILSK